MVVLADFETRSRADLKRIGGRNYAHHASTEALCCVFYDTDTKESGLWSYGDPPPFTEAEAAALEVGAHNAANFDRHVWEAIGWPAPARWFDTSQYARRAGLPGSLDALAQRWLGRGKDKEGSRFTLSLSRPSRAAARRGQLPPLTAEVMARVHAYCQSDVEVLAHGWDRLEPWADVSPLENAVLEVDGIINDRGVAFDSDLARALLACDEHNGTAALELCARELGMSPAEVQAIANSPTQFADFTGAPNAQAETVAGLLSEPGEVGAMARARVALASIARGKLEAGLARVSPDGRIRDALKYLGGHTWRWSHTGMQMGNMARPAKDFEKWGDDEVCALADRVVSGTYIATQAEIDMLMRATLVAKPGHVLIVEDFSGVEARGLAWAAGDFEALEIFRTGAIDVYIKAAAGIFGVPYDNIAKSDPRRQVGKVAELACLAGDTRVLTERGWLAITEVCASDRLWDGVEWVNHGGLIPRGTREVVDLFGLTATPDHLVWCGTEGWCHFGLLGFDENTRSLALAKASESLPLQAFCVCQQAAFGSCLCSAVAAPPNTACSIATCERVGQHVAMCAQKGSRVRTEKSISSTPPSCPTMSTGDGFSIGSRPSCNGVRTRAQSSTAITAGVAYACTTRGEKAGRNFSRTSQRYPAGMIRDSNSIGPTTSVDTSQEICVSSPGAPTTRTGATCKGCSGASSNLRPVYDLAHAGPRNRFTVWTEAGPLIVHNCGYQGGWRALENMARGMGISLDNVPGGAAAVVEAFRAQHPALVRFWRAMQNAALSAVDGVPASVGPFELTYDGDDVVMLFPADRPIVYGGMHTVMGEYGPSLVFTGTKSGREFTYGGKLTENAIQGLCRDILAEKLVECERAGLAPVLHVHDEIVCEVPASAEREARETLHAIMTTAPRWCAGFPLGATGHAGKRYRK
jgi:hypothetical protein